jgi:hypothetical protein
MVTARSILEDAQPKCGPAGPYFRDRARQRANHYAAFLLSFDARAPPLIVAASTSFIVGRS